MSVIKMQVSPSGITLISASIDIPLDGELTALTLAVGMFVNTTPASGDYVAAELSFLSSDSIGSGHDTRGSLAEVTSSVIVGLANSHQIPVQPSVMISNLGVRVNAGERIFIHGIASAADISGRAEAYLFIRDKMDKAAARRR